MSQIIRFALLVVLVLFLGGLRAGVSAQGEPPGAPTRIVEPLDPQGNVRVSVAGTVPVTVPQPLKVTAAAPIEVTASQPLPVTLASQSSRGPTLLTLAENLNLQPGTENRFLWGWQDVKTVSSLRLYARILSDWAGSPSPSSPPPMVSLRVTESPTGIVGDGYYTSLADVKAGSGQGYPPPEGQIPPSEPSWQLLNPTVGPAPGGPASARWVAVVDFGSPRTNILIGANNRGSAPVTISLYLLMD